MSDTKPSDTNPNEPLLVELSMDTSWRYASGAALEHMSRELTEGRIVALACDGCGRRHLPPRPVCGACHLELTRWVPVAEEGELVAFSVVHVPILDGRTGEPRPSPYGMGLVRLDGADTTLNHYLTESDPARLAIGQRVRAVWREERRGAIDDILAFEVLR